MMVGMIVLTSDRPGFKSHLGHFLALILGKMMNSESEPHTNWGDSFAPFLVGLLQSI